MHLSSQKINIRKRIKIGIKSPVIYAYICELTENSMLIECNEVFPEDSVVICKMSLDQGQVEFKAEITSVSKAGISFQMIAKITRSPEALVKFYRSKLREKAGNAINTKKKKKGLFW